MKTQTYACCIPMSREVEIGVRAAGVFLRSVSKPSCFRRILNSVSVCPDWSHLKLDQHFRGILEDANLSFEHSHNEVSQTAALDSVRKSLANGSLAVGLLFRVCLRELKKIGLRIPHNPYARRRMLSHHEIGMLFQKVLANKTWGDLLEALQVEISRRYAVWVGKAQCVVTLPVVGEDGEAAEADVLEVLGSWDPNRPAVVERYRILHELSVATADAVIAHILLKRCFWKMLEMYEIEVLRTHLITFIEDYFSSDPAQGPDQIHEYFGFLSNSARSRLVGHPYLSGKKGWSCLGLIWRIMVEVVRKNPVFSDFFGSDLDPLLKYFGLITTA